MAKKKKPTKREKDAEDLEAFALIVDKLTALGQVSEKIWGTALFTFAWWKAYGSGPLPTTQDVILGALYAFTVPEALRGGILANSYALGVLAALGVGFIPDEVWDYIPNVAEDIRAKITGEAPEFQEFFDEATAAGWVVPLITIGSFPLHVPDDVFASKGKMEGGKWRTKKVHFRDQWMPCREAGGTWNWDWDALGCDKSPLYTEGNP